MSDPLSVTGSLLAVVTASVVSIKSLKETVERYRGRDETLQRLLGHLDDLISILQTLEEVAQLEASILTLLEGPVKRCRLLCHEFQTAMEAFAGKSKTTFRDWAKLEFMQGDISGFMDTLSRYKSTISVGLGTITLQKTQTTQDILKRYSEMVQDTTYNLNIQLQRINEKLEQPSSSESGAFAVDLQDEKTVIEHCIRICEEAMSHIGGVVDREQQLHSDALLGQATVGAASDELKHLQIHRQTREMLGRSRDDIAKFLGRLQERRRHLSCDGDPGQDQHKAQLEEDIKALEDSLEVCKIASSEVNRQKVHSFGEVVAEGDSDQVVVTTWADFFNVTKAISKGTSAQLIGSMTSQELIQLSKDRYGSRFGAVKPQVDVTPLPAQNNGSRVPGPGASVPQPSASPKPTRAAPNEARKRPDGHSHP